MLAINDFINILQCYIFRWNDLARQALDNLYANHDEYNVIFLYELVAEYHDATK